MSKVLDADFNYIFHYCTWLSRSRVRRGVNRTRAMLRATIWLVAHIVRTLPTSSYVWISIWVVRMRLLTSKHNQSTSGSRSKFSQVQTNNSFSFKYIRNRTKSKLLSKILLSLRYERAANLLNLLLTWLHGTSNMHLRIVFPDCPRCWLWCSLLQTSRCTTSMQIRHHEAL